MQWVRLFKIGFLLFMTYAFLAAVISAFTVPADLFVVSILGWLVLFSVGTWRFVALGYAARQRNRRDPGTRIDFVNEVLMNLIGIIGAGPFGLMLLVSSLGQPREGAWKAFIFGALGLLGALLSYVDLRKLLQAGED